MQTGHLKIFRIMSGILKIHILIYIQQQGRFNNVSY